MSDATLQLGGRRPVIRLERHLGAPPKEVWRAITDPEELKSWFPCQVAVEEWKVGAALRFSFSQHDVADLRGTVLEVDEPRVLSFTWGDETLRIELTPASDGGTHLVFTDELAPGIAARNAAGWDVCLDRLAGKAPDDAEWKPRFDHYVAAFKPALGPQEGPPGGVEAAAG